MRPLCDAHGASSHTRYYGCLSFAPAHRDLGLRPSTLPLLRSGHCRPAEHSPGARAAKLTSMLQPLDVRGFASYKVVLKRALLAAEAADGRVLPERWAAAVSSLVRDFISTGDYAVGDVEKKRTCSARRRRDYYDSHLEPSAPALLLHPAASLHAAHMEHMPAEHQTRTQQ